MDLSQFSANQNDHLVEIAGTQGVTPPAAYTIIRRLVEAGVLVELTGRTYDRIFAAPEVLKLART